MVFYSLIVSGQSTSVDVDTIQVVADKRIAQKNIKENIATINSINQLLENNSSAFIKSYGIGSLATISMQGGSANQFLLSWNNIPINNPMLGISDFSLVPIDLFDTANIDKGNNTAKYGSGAMTGRLDLSNNTVFKGVDFGLKLGVGSFGQRKIGFQIGNSKNKLSYATKFSYDQSQNDFPYSLGGTEQTLDHARFNNIALLQDIDFNFNKKNTLSLSLWLQDTNREIPPTTVQTESKAKQNDQFLRLQAAYKLIKNNASLEIQTAYFDELNAYQDSLILVNNDNKFKKIFASVDYQYVFPKLDVLLSIRNQFSRNIGSTEAYRQDRVQDVYAIFVELKKSWSKFEFGFYLAKEFQFNNNFDSPFSPKLQASYLLEKNTKLDLSISNEYRSPTLNELYWRPGGNIDLKAESGIGQQIGIRTNQESFDFNVNIFHRKIDNWILWSPSDLGFYSAKNIAAVRSYGFSLEGNYGFDYKRVQYQFNLIYDFARSENLVANQFPKLAVGQQLFYTPIHHLKIGADIKYKTWSTYINSRYVSETLGLLETLKGYFIANIGFQKSFKLRKYDTDLAFSINNLSNSDYRIIERRPMPGRNFLLTAFIKIN